MAIEMDCFRQGAGYLFQLQRTRVEVICIRRAATDALADCRL